MARKGWRTRKIHLEVPITVRYDVDVAKKIYRVADEHFKGNVSEAMREAARLLFEKWLKKNG